MYERERECRRENAGEREVLLGEWMRERIYERERMYARECMRASGAARVRENV